MKSARANSEETLRGWMQISAISLLMFSISFGLIKMIAQSPWTQARFEQDRLMQENTGLLDKVIEIRQAEGRLDPDSARRMTTLREDLEKVKDRLATARREERPVEEREALAGERQTIKKELRAVKLDIVRSTAALDDSAHYVTLARKSLRNMDRLAELDAMSGFFYSTGGQIILILTGFFLSVVMWLGIGGIVFLSILGGINTLLSST